MDRRALTILGALLIAAPTANAGLADRVFVSGFEGVGTHCGRADTFPCDRVISDFVDREDPETWTVDPDTGVQYRRATANELSANGWRPGTFVMDGSSLNPAADGRERVNLVVPLEDNHSVPIAFDLLRSSEGLEFMRRDYEPGTIDGILVSELITPTQHEYVQVDFDRADPRPSRGVWARMLAGEDGGVYATGLLEGREFEVDGNSHAWQIDVVAPDGDVSPPSNHELVKVSLLGLGTYGEAQFNQCAGGGGCDWLCDASAGVPCDDNPHADPSPPSHCSDGTDNDGDGTNNSGDEECKDRPEWGDDVHPGFPKRLWESGKSMVLMGEGRFCTHYAGSWIQRLTRMGWDSEALMNASRSFTGLTGGEMALRFLGAGCWIFDSLDQANDCRVNGNDCPSGYPYASAGSTASNYYNNVWDDVHQGTLYGWTHAQHLAQTVYWGGTNASNGSVMSCSGTEGSGCCGATVYPGSNPQRGASVVQYEISSGGCNAAKAHASSAHEIGHTYGMDHDDAHGYMDSPSKTSAQISDFNRGLLMGCLGNYNCPRPSGFRYVP